ncbi:MAG: AAA family ATPase [Alphaproteobacteria bacterium]
MIGEASKIGSYFGLLKYLFSPAGGEEERVAWIHADDDFLGDDPKTISHFMESHAAQNPRVKQSGYHLILSFAPEDSPSKEQQIAAARKVMESIGLKNNHYVMVAHRDKDYDHVHIIVNRVGRDLKTWDTKWDYVKIEVAIRQVEVEYNLRRVMGKWGGIDGVRLPFVNDNFTDEERKQLAKTDKEVVAQLKELMQESVRSAFSWAELHTSLKEAGLAIQKKGNGFVITNGIRSIKASKIDRAYSYASLRARFGSFSSYNPERRKKEDYRRIIEKLDHHEGVYRLSSLRRALAKSGHKPEEADLIKDMAKRGYQIMRQGKELYITSKEYLRLEREYESTLRNMRGSTREYLKEERALDSIERLNKGGLFRRLPKSEQLSDEQLQALRAIAADPNQISVLIGKAGVGKTRVLQPLVKLFAEQGYDIHAVALSNIAKDALGQSVNGVAKDAEAETIASLKYKITEGKTSLTRKSLLLIDEASMVGLEDAHFLLQKAHKSGAKVILVGDNRQLAPVAAGAPFNELMRESAVASLSTIRRQQVEWQRQATIAFSQGDTETALKAYEQHGRVIYRSTAEKARYSLVQHYIKRIEEGKRVAILAFRNSDVTALNDEAHLAFKTANPKAKTAILTTQSGSKEFAEGERIIITENMRATGLANGNFAEIIHISGKAIRIKTEKGKSVILDTRKQIGFDYGHATTIHKAQGATVDESLFYFDRLTNENLAYVALSRHTDDATIFVNKEAMPYWEKDITRSVRAAEPAIKAASLENITKKYTQSAQKVREQVQEQELSQEIKQEKGLRLRLKLRRPKVESDES